MRWEGGGDGEGEGDGDGATGVGLGDGDVTAACCGPAHDNSVARQTITIAADRLIAITQFARSRKAARILGVTHSMRHMLALVAVLTIAGCGASPPSVSGGPLGPLTGGPGLKSATCPYMGGPAGRSAPLSVKGFGRIAIDPLHCQAFVSSPGSDAIVVVDYSGRVVRTITGEFGADAMVVSGLTLYVTLTTAGAIDAISTAQTATCSIREVSCLGSAARPSLRSVETSTSRTR
jgi:hypothetical protein